MATYTKQPSSVDARNASDDTGFTGATGNNISLDHKSDQIRHMYLKFDISDFIYASSTINSATISLYYYSTGVGTPTGRIDCWKCTKNWVEGQACWDNYATGTAWTTPGGDYATSSPAGGYANLPAEGNWLTITITDLVKDAIDTGSSIVNVLVKYNSEVSASRDIPVFILVEKQQTQH